LPQIDGDRLAPRNHLDNFFVDHSFGRVDADVGRHQLARRVFVAGRQSFDRFRNLPLGKLTHFSEHLQ
jgi:hypothetical protein